MYQLPSVQWQQGIEERIAEKVYNHRFQGNLKSWGFFKITEIKVIQANVQMIGGEQKSHSWRNVIESDHIRHYINTYQCSERPRFPAL